MSALNVLPMTPEADPCDHRTQSAPVVIQTVDGNWYTARWTVYQDEEDFAPVWELIGRDGLQLERDEVVAWFYPAAVSELVGCSDATVRAFESLGKADGVIANLEAHRECERALIAQKVAIARASGGAA